MLRLYHLLQVLERLKLAFLVQKRLVIKNNNFKKKLSKKIVLFVVLERKKKLSRSIFNFFH